MKNRVVERELSTLFQKHVIELVLPHSLWGFIQIGLMRPFIELSILNKHLLVPNLKMKAYKLGVSIYTDIWYMYLLNSSFFKDLSSVCLEQNIYAFRITTLGLHITPMDFNRMFHVVVSYLHTRSILSHSYMDDYIVKRFSAQLLDKHTRIVKEPLL